jgi:hypothetical protein
MTDERPGLDALTTVMHDSLCGCGGRCYGWDSDRMEINAWLEERYGSSWPLENLKEYFND